MTIYLCERCKTTQYHNKFGLCSTCGAIALVEGE
jgi:ribosomal protein L37E